MQVVIAHMMQCTMHSMFLAERILWTIVLHLNVSFGHHSGKNKNCQQLPIEMYCHSTERAEWWLLKLFWSILASLIVLFHCCVSQCACVLLLLVMFRNVKTRRAMFWSRPLARSATWSRWRSAGWRRCWCPGECPMVTTAQCSPSPYTAPVPGWSRNPSASRCQEKFVSISEWIPKRFVRQSR